MIHERLLLPALRAAMGDWTYYIASMTLEELAHRVTTATTLHQPESPGRGYCGIPAIPTATSVWDVSGWGRRRRARMA